MMATLQNWCHYGSMLVPLNGELGLPWFLAKGLLSLWDQPRYKCKKDWKIRLAICNLLAADASHWTQSRSWHSARCPDSAAIARPGTCDAPAIVYQDLARQVPRILLFMLLYGPTSPPTKVHRNAERRGIPPQLSVGCRATFAENILILDNSSRLPNAERLYPPLCSLKAT